MRFPKRLAAGLAVALVTTSAASAQRRLSAPDAAVGVTVALKAGSNAYAFTGPAACRHAPRASIYGTPAAMWSVRQSQGDRSFVLTFWKPNGQSGDMFSLAMTTGGNTYSANTAKGPAGGDVAGSGTVTFAPAGASGTFVVDVTAANGTKIAGTVKCGAFTGMTAEGGD